MCEVISFINPPTMIIAAITEMAATIKNKWLLRNLDLCHTQKSPTPERNTEPSRPWILPLFFLLLPSSLLIVGVVTPICAEECPFLRKNLLKSALNHFWFTAANAKLRLASKAKLVNSFFFFFLWSLFFFLIFLISYVGTNDIIRNFRVAVDRGDWLGATLFRFVCDWALIAPFWIFFVFFASSINTRDMNFFPRTFIQFLGSKKFHFSI